ncbi:MAG: hypothetical protein QW468_01195 [Candidatus Bathyarchaeia archaeon]
MTDLEQLKKTGIQKLLVSGVDTVFVAASAKRAGYDVYVADYFGDSDLKRFCSDFKAIIKQKNGRVVEERDLILNRKLFWKWLKH